MANWIQPINPSVKSMLHRAGGKSFILLTFEVFPKSFSNLFLTRCKILNMTTRLTSRGRDEIASLMILFKLSLHVTLLCVEDVNNFQRMRGQILQRFPCFIGLTWYGSLKLARVG